MRKYTALIAAAGLAISAGIAFAQSQTPRNYDSSGAPQSSGQRSGGGMSGGPTTGAGGTNSGMTGAPSSSNPQAGGGAGGLTTSPHQVPENGGAPNSTAPGSNPR